MRVLTACLFASLMTVAAPVFAQNISAGSNITVNSDWHAKNGGPYTTKVVACKSSSGLCVRDPNFSPSTHPMIKTAKGLQVKYESVSIVYLFRPKGRGTFHDLTGKKVGTFRWSQN